MKTRLLTALLALAIIGVNIAFFYVAHEEGFKISVILLTEASLLLIGAIAAVAYRLSEKRGERRREILHRVERTWFRSS